MEAPYFFNGGNPQFAPEKQRYHDQKPIDHFLIEDLLDFSNEDAIIASDQPFDASATNSTDSSTIIDSCNSSLQASNPYFSSQFSTDLCVPYDDVAELEWLSNFVEESFSTEDLEKLQLISGLKVQTDEEGSEWRGFSDEGRENPVSRTEVSVPSKARSKRSRAAPCNWSSSSSEYGTTAAAVSGKKTKKSAMRNKESSDGYGGEGRKCLHCATEKTPQWRTGPRGPKTLCNACGVRYKSGRLVPEYRPAASPTFVLTRHSNSHRKVMDLRRQKELQRPQMAVFDISTGDESLIHHIRQDFRQLF